MKRYFLLKFFHIATDEDDIDNPERKEKEKKAIEDRKPSLTISQFESSKKGSKEQIKVVLKKFRMTTIQRDELTKLSL